MSDTPETDAAIVSAEYIRREMDYYKHKFVLADIARRLERERDAAREALRECQQTLAMLTDPERIKQSRVQVAWAQAVAAEQRDRAILEAKP